MSKRLVLRLGVMVAALSAMTLLQGCDEDNNGVTVAGAWMPVGSGTLPMFIFGTATGGGGMVGGGGTQGATGATTGATAGAVAAGAGGGGGQVSTGVAF